MHPVTIAVEAVASGINHTMVAAHDRSTRAGEVLTGGVSSKDFPNGRVGIRKVPIARELPLLLDRFALACVAALLCQPGSLADLLIGISGTAHARRRPILDDSVGVCIHGVLSDRHRRN